MLWALAQPAAVAGLMAAFVLGVGVRALAQALAAQLSGPRDQSERRQHNFCPLGVVAAVLCGTGWGREAATGGGRRAVLAGPLAVLAVSQVAFAAHHAAYPGPGLLLRLNRPSDVLHGAVAPTLTAQLMISVAVGLLCFGLLALLPLPPFDGYRLLSPATSAGRRAAERLAAVVVLLLLAVPVAGRPPLLAALDAVAGPVVRAWA